MLQKFPDYCRKLSAHGQYLKLSQICPDPVPKINVDSTLRILLLPSRPRAWHLAMLLPHCSAHIEPLQSMKRCEENSGWKHEPRGRSAKEMRVPLSNGGTLSPLNGDASNLLGASAGSGRVRDRDRYSNGKKSKRGARTGGWTEVASNLSECFVLSKKERLLCVHVDDMCVVATSLQLCACNFNSQSSFAIRFCCFALPPFEPRASWLDFM